MESTVREGMSLEDFLREGSKHKFEIINGKRRIDVPSPSGHSATIRALFVALYFYCSTKLLGEVFSETSFILPDTYDSDWVQGSRIPDVMFYTAERFSAFLAENKAWRQRPFDIVPDLVVEVVSPNDTYSEMLTKIEAYLADGVRLIWVVDPQRLKATVYSPDTERGVELSGEDTLEGEDVIPGFKVNVSEIFS